ncbi:MAG: AAA family ATPase [Acidobacteria bacterium]|nr:AAA family ATPase [Acidobacteriota bacterium]
MFKLQRLEITGFKSFADYTELVFTGEGITAIVGPNGCGKSNVSDAISWVLGEQRVKHLRGSDMKDVIFQGSRNRAPSGMAEVVLHLVRDETTAEEPDIEDIDSTLEEIDEHEEQIEAKLAPEILGDDAPETLDAEATTPAANDAAQLSQTTDAVTTGASLADQSQTAPFSSSTDLASADASASQAMTAKARHHAKRHWRPRRLALGFAPGETVSVARRLYRDGESEYLLNGRACRLRDIQDLFSGTGLSGAHYAIVEQGRIGQILSAKPMDRRTLIEEAAGITKFRVRQRAAEARLEGARMNLRRVSDIVATELEDREGETRSVTATAREREEELATARGAVADAALRRDRRERERAYREEQAESLEQRIADIEAQVENLHERLAGVRAEGERLRAGEARLRDESEQSAESLRSAEADYARLLNEVLDAESQIEAARAELLTHTAVAERLSEIGRQLEATLERLAAQAEGLEREGERARAAHAEFESKAAALQIEIDAARGRLDKLLAERETAAAGVAEARSLVSTTLDEYARMREDAARVRNRLETLAELDAKRSLYSQAVQRIFSDELLDEAERDPSKDFHTVGTLADMLRVEPQWERAVEGIFGGYLQTVIVPTPDDAARAAAWLAASGAGRATFLVAGIHGAGVDDMEAGDPYSRVTVADLGARDVRLGDVLGSPRELLSVLNRTLRREMGARIVASLEEATAGSYETGELYVTLDGEWVSGGQLVGAGGAAQVDEATGLLAFKREMRELETRASELASEVVSAEDSLSAARARLVELEETLLLLG